MLTLHSTKLTQKLTKNYKTNKFDKYIDDKNRRKYKQLEASFKIC